MKKSYLLLADGFEETEALGTLDVLRRAGLDVLTVSINPSFQVTGAHGVTIMADLVMNDFMGEPEWVILPGGMPGASNLAADRRVTEMLTKQSNTGGYIAAICASPAVVLAPLGILDGIDATCYPGFEGQCGGAAMTGARVVVTDTVITAAGPGCTFDFGLAIVEKACGSEAVKTLREQMLLK